MPVTDWTPTSDEVAVLERSRTKDANGKYWGVFRSETESEPTRTTPTKEQVESTIQAALDEVAGALGADLPDGPADDVELVRRAGKRVAALSAAMLIETDFFPEQVGSGKSPYDALERRYLRALAGAKELVSEYGTGGSGESVAQGGGYPDSEFPENEGGMIGWGTKF